MRIVFIIIFSLCGLLARSYDFWYEKPRDFASGIYAMGDNEGKTIAASSMQVRARSVGDRTPWGIIWDMTDSLSYTRARLTLPQSRHFDDDFGSYYGLVVERVDSGRSTVLHEVAPGGLHGVERGYNTLKLISDNTGEARLYAGNKELVDMGAYRLKGGTFALWTGGSKHIDVQRLCLELDTIAPPRFSTEYFALLASSQAHTIPADSVTVTGRWEFLDREIKSSGTHLGGKYTLAVVSTAGGGYEIVYLQGADVNTGLWRYGCVKGYLKPTSFAGDFDLIWYDSLGREIIGEQSATLSSDGSLLIFNFPLAKASLRFRRAAIDTSIDTSRE